MTRTRFLLACTAFVVPATPAAAQVAFVPQVASFPNGVVLSATPVVSYDRRYVRMTLNPQFTALEGFTETSIPFAVSGSRPPGGGGGGGGFPSMTVAAGMDGLMAPGRGYDDGPMAPSGYAAYAYPGSAAGATAALTGATARPAPTPRAGSTRQPGRTARSKSKPKRPAAPAGR